MRIYLTFEGPILSGSISTARSRCGKPNCACKKDPPHLHGIYYRWTGLINGKRTTKTISNEIALECKQRLKNYYNLQQKIEKLIYESITTAPWVSKMKNMKRRKKS